MKVGLNQSCQRIFLLFFVFFFSQSSSIPVLQKRKILRPSLEFCYCCVFVTHDVMTESGCLKQNSFQPWNIFLRLQNQYSVSLLVLQVMIRVVHRQHDTVQYLQCIGTKRKALIKKIKIKMHCWFSITNQTSSPFSFPNHVLCIVLLGMMITLGTAAAVASSTSLPWPWTSSASNTASVRTSAFRNPSTRKQCWPPCPFQCFGWAVSLGNKR